MTETVVCSTFSLEFHSYRVMNFLFFFKKYFYAHRKNTHKKFNVIQRKPA